MNDCYKCFPGGVNGKKPIVDAEHLCFQHLGVIIVGLLRKIVDYQEVNLKSRGLLR